MAHSNKNGTDYQRQSRVEVGEFGKWRILAERIVYRRGLLPDYTLEQLQEKFIEYVEFYSQTRAVYLQKTRQKKGGSGSEVGAERVERLSPMTEWSFCVWIGKDRGWLATRINEMKQMEHKNDYENAYLDFLLQLRTFLNSQLLEGAIVGEYTPNIVASLLHIKNQIDVTSNGKTTGNGAPVINIVADTATREDYQRQAEEQMADADTEE